MCVKCLKERSELKTNQVGIKAFACQTCREVELQMFDVIDGEWVFTGITQIVPFEGFSKLCISSV